ncbi:MAG: spermidine synthase, partial [Planctomycetaceae bacterium]
MGALPVYAVSVLLSATLLFSIQPMFARMVLPLLGGTPAVWNTCMVFFQAVLLAGYAYAHLTARYLSPRVQSIVHLVVAASPILLLPIALPNGTEPPTESTPVFWLLGLLTVAVGAPFFVLSTTAPLLQHWFSKTDHPSANDPYFLYAASNVGSMAALLGYPILIEPNLRLAAQSSTWTWGYFGLCALLALCAVYVWTSKRSFETVGEVAAETAKPRGKSKAAPTAEVTFVRRLRWIALSFVPSSWMLGVTTHLTTDIAPVPMLWVIPLSLYLLSFILVFSKRAEFLHHWMLQIFAPSLMLLLLTALFESSWIILVAHLVVFFIGCMVCHGELARDRPPVAHLTEYYFWMSAGGVLGGIFNALVAPLVFHRLLEYPIAVAVGAILQRSLHPERKDSTSRMPELISLAVVLAGAALLGKTHESSGHVSLVYFVLAASPVLILLYFADRPRLFALGVGAVLLAGKMFPPNTGAVLYNDRSFFGVLWVQHTDLGRVLLHGTTKHGVQSNELSRQCEPLSYYWRGGTLGQVFQSIKKPSSNEVAVVGLGAGATVCYRDLGYRFTFYEIDPLVRDIAENPKYFTYLSDCGRGDYEIILGDGRLKLAEADDGRYGMICFDAFSSDSIPMHLLTREALAMYLDKLSPDGTLVFHISNRHLDLRPVLAALAADANLVCMYGDDVDYFRTDLDEKLKTGIIP